MGFMKIKLTISILMLAFAQVANANLIRNASFEDIPGTIIGQGIMPSEWVIANVTPDTYSNDGSYGLAPSAGSGGGNFTGVTAQDGIRWVAGWSSANEYFGQTLSDTLVGGQSYTFSSYLIQAKRSDLDHTGGYDIFLSSSSTEELLGSIGPTTDSNDWEFSSLVFTAPSNSSLLPFLLFKPFGDTTGGAYPGLDNVSLTATDSTIPAVPVPAAIWLFGTALVGFVGLSRRRKVA